MHKQLKRADLYFRTVLYTTEELLTSADFKALDNYVLSELKQDVRVYTAAVKLPRELYIKPLKSRRIFFQITDLPPQKQREAVAVLLAKFPYISPQFFVSMLQNKDAYIN
ncbi:MAG: hypothetical protein LBD99_04100, partial [Candidatus Margulisbacteria bacterium]|nr:hypothetical protein [Candidatus Margulisiibacteriota bacterium]